MRNSEQFIPESEKPQEAIETPEGLENFAQKIKGNIERESEQAIKAGEDRIANEVPSNKNEQGKAAFSEIQAEIRNLTSETQEEIDQVLKE